MAERQIIKREGGFQFGQRFISRQQSRALQNVKPVEVGEKGALFTVASEEPYYRWFLDANEVLSMREDAVDLDWLGSGRAPFLYNHDRNFYLGIIRKSYIENNELYAEVDFKSRGEAGEIFQDLRDGYLGGATSIAYEILELQLTKEDEITVTRWRGLEASLVTIPADTTVGLQEMGNQNVDSDPKPDPIPEPKEAAEVAQRSQEQITQIEEKEGDMTGKGGGFEPQEGEDQYKDFREEEKKRQKNIRFMGQKFGVSEEQQNEWIDNNTDLNEVSRLCQKMDKDHKPVAAPSGFLSKKEQKRYSLNRLLRYQLGMAGKSQKLDDVGFEMEVSNYIARSIGKEPTEGVYIPMRDLTFGMKREALQTGTVPSGGALLDTELDVANFTEALLNQTMSFAMGVRLLSGLEGPVDIPIETDTPETFWVGEGEPIGQSASTFELAQLRMKEIACITPVTKRMLLQSSLDMEAYIRDILVRKIAIGIDYSILNGTGQQDEPLGLLNYPGLLTASLGTDGGQLDWDAIVDLQTALAVRNAKRDSGCGYMTNPKVEGELRKTQKFAGDSDEIWEMMPQSENYMGMLAGYPAGCTNQIPSNLSQGASNDLSALIFAYWPDIVAGEFGVMEVLANPYGRGFYNNMVDIKATMGFDVTFVRDAVSFAAYKDVQTPGGTAFSRQG